jgi:hypothetical protein
MAKTCTAKFFNIDKDFGSSSPTTAAPMRRCTTGLLRIPQRFQVAHRLRGSREADRVLGSFAIALKVDNKWTLPGALAITPRVPPPLEGTEWKSSRSVWSC